MTTISSHRSGYGPRLAFTAAVGAIFAVAIAFVRVPTSLGVQAPEPASFFVERDLSGREYIWRVWWRARDDLIDVNPQWVVTAGLVAMLALFAVGAILAIWLVTKPIPISDDEAAPADG